MSENINGSVGAAFPEGARVQLNHMVDGQAVCSRSGTVVGVHADGTTEIKWDDATGAILYDDITIQRVKAFLSATPRAYLESIPAPKETADGSYAVRCSIKELVPPVGDVYRYSVNVLRSVDGGKTFWFCGDGQFCRTIEEAETYADMVDGGERCTERLMAWLVDYLNSNPEVENAKHPSYRFVKYLCKLAQLDDIDACVRLMEKGYTFTYADNDTEQDAKNAIEAAYLLKHPDKAD